MFISIANHNSEKIPKGFKCENVDFKDIPKRIKNDQAYCACKLKDEYRLDKNFEGHVDFLILDVDESCSLVAAQNIFKKFTYFIITTRHHQREKNNVVCDRFRVFIPLDETVHDGVYMRTLYEQAINKYPFLDKSCVNVSRLFYASPKDSIVIENDGKPYKTKLMKILKQEDYKLPDIKPTPLPNQEFEYKKLFGRDVKVIVGGAEDVEYSGELDEEAHLRGIEKYLEDEYYAGNRANALFSAACMMRNDNFSQDEAINYLLAYFNKHGGKSQNVALSQIVGAYKY